MNHSTPTLHRQNSRKSFGHVTPIRQNDTSSVNKRRSSLINPPHFKKQKSDSDIENNVVDDLFTAEDFMVDIFEPITRSNSDEDIFLDTNNDKENVQGNVSKLLNQSFPNTGDLSALFTNKLLENAGNIGSIDKSTGWTQFQDKIEDKKSVPEFGPFYGLPARVQNLVEKYKGISDLYEWQKECLKLPAIENRKNLVYALPTSGGKTLVAELLIFREILCYKKNVLFVLPFVAIVQEKVRSLSPFAIDLGFLVEEYAAGKGTIPPRKRRRRQTVFVCTIEKALAVVQSLIEEKRLDEIGLVVVDELHLLGEGSGRGATLEILITYLIQASEKIHIVGMSATIGNLNEIAKFLKAETYSGEFRPVELTEYVKTGSDIFKVDKKSEDILSAVRKLPPVSNGDPDGIGLLVQEVCPADSVLIFCSTKKNCENIAKLLCSQLPRLFLEHRMSEKKSIIDALTAECNNQLCPILRSSLRYGVAYHHSGLTSDERKLLEEAYREGVLCCICCTSTLAAGVNLPAKRVILRAPYVARDFINLSKYKQMVGRAGRAGLGAIGESFLICQPSDSMKVGKLLNSKMDDSVSAFNVEHCKDLIMSAVGLGVATTRTSLRQLFYRTLYFVQSERLKVDISKIIDECLASLFKLGALRTKKSSLEKADESKLDVSLLKENKPKKMIRVGNSAELCVSRLGRAAMKGCMSLPVAQKLYADLMKAEKNFVLQCSLHLLYLVTPYQLPEHMTINLSIYCDVLNAEEQHAAAVIGISEKHVSRMIMGQKPKDVPSEVVNRFYVTLILNELLKQRTFWDVSLLFQIPRGMVQSLMASAASFSWNVLRFCEELEELWTFKAILTDFAPRLAHCCEHELLPLMDLPSIKRARARQLLSAGFKNLETVAQANARDLVSAVDLLPLKTAHQIIAAAKLLLLEKAESLKEEADDVLEKLQIENH